MKSAVPKVLHPAAGLPLIEHVLRTADTINPASVVLIVGHQADAVQAALTARPGVRFALQEPQLGTGHALLQAEAALTGATGTVVLLSGDVPLLRPQTLEALVRQHQASGAAATVLTALMDDPSGYGRIERHDGRIAAIVEHKDANADQRAIKEINSGIYAFDVAPLFDALRQIGSANAQGEYYLPDLVRIYRERGLPVETVVLDDAREIMGVNSRAELAQVAEVLRMSKNEALMAAGVTIVDPATAYIGPDVTIGPDTIDPSERPARRPHPHRLRLRHPVGRPHRQFDACRRRLHQQPLPGHRFDASAAARASGRSRTSGPSRTSARMRTSATSSS